MKFFTICLILFASLFVSTSTSAQFKLKKLDNVVVSMSEGQTIADYTKYLTGYFERIDILETLTNKSNYSIVTAEDKKFIQGEGLNASQQKVVFRIEVTTSADGLTITKAESDFKALACVAVSCTDCAFKDAYNCGCNSEGSCEQSLSM